MTMRSLNWCTATQLDCGSIPVTAFLCVTPSIVFPEPTGDFGYVEATLSAVRASTCKDSCGTCKWVYTITYDDSQLVEGFILSGPDIKQVLCEDCLVEFILAQSSCEKVRTCISVEDTNSVDMTYDSGTGIISSDVKLSSSVGNAIHENADGLYATPGLVSCEDVALCFGETFCWNLVTTEADLITINSLAVGGIAVGANVTLTAPITINIPLTVLPCGLIITNGNVFTLNNSFECGVYRCFNTSSNEVVFNSGTVGEIFPQWFGAVSDGLTACGTQINAMFSSIKAFGGNVFFPPGEYLVLNTINIQGSHITVKGNESTLIYDNEAFGLSIFGTEANPISDIEISGLTLTQLHTGSTSGSQQALQANFVRRIRVLDCRAYDWAVGYKFNTDCNHIWVERCYLHNIGAGGVGGIGIYVEGDDGDGEEDYDNNKVWILDNHVDGCIYGCEVKFVQDFVISGNIVENTAGIKYAILAVRDTGAGDESIVERGIISDNIVRNCVGEGIFVKGINITVTGNVVENSDHNAYHLAGANIVFSNNIAYNCFSAASIIYDSGVTDGTALPPEIDSAKFIITNNLFMLITGTDPAVSFNICSDSLIQGNVLHDYKGTGGNAYGYKFISCVNTRVLDNYADGGIYGYRIETSSTGLTWNNNKAVGYTNYGVDIPTAHPGWTLEDGDYTSKYYSRLVTADDTPAAVKTFTVTTADTSLHLKAKVNCKSVGGSSKAGAYEVEVLVKRSSGNLAIVGSVVTLFAEETDAGLDATWTVSTNTVSLTVTGLAATNLIWVAEIERMDNL